MNIATIGPAVPLDPSAWTGNLGGALANATSLSVTLEFNDAIVELAGFDNFQLAAVPEPSAARMACLGQGLLGLRRSARR